MRDVSSDQQIYKKQMNKIITLAIGFAILIGVSFGMYYFLSIPDLKDSQIEQILGAGIFSALIGIVLLILGFSKKQNNQEVQYQEQEHELAHA